MEHMAAPVAAAPAGGAAAPAGEENQNFRFSWHLQDKKLML